MKNNKRLDGQALIELILVTGILALILVTLVSLTVVSLSTVQKTRLQTRANIIAQQGMENIRAIRDETSWNDFANQCVDNVQTWADWTSVDMSGGDYIPTATCDNTNPLLVIISTKVDWTFSGKAYNVELETSLGQPDEAIYR